MTDEPIFHFKILLPSKDRDNNFFSKFLYSMRQRVCEEFQRLMYLYQWIEEEYNIMKLTVPVQRQRLFIIMLYQKRLVPRHRSYKWQLVLGDVLIALSIANKGIQDIPPST